MTFVDPSLLILLLIIPVAVVFFVWRSRMRANALRGLGDVARVRELSARVSVSRRRWKSFLWLVAITGVIIALARPVWGVRDDIIEVQGIAIMVVLDVSASMKAEDVLPSRLERAKLAARELFESREGNQVGLILFAGDAFVQFPLTVDSASAVTFLNAASTESVTRQGTALEEALQLAIASFDNRIATHSVVVLLSDGESHEGRAVRAAEEAATRGITIHAIGYGTLDGAPIPQRDESGQLTGYKLDRAGNVVVSRLEEQILRDVAAETGGLYQQATESGIEMVNLRNRIAELEAGVLGSRTQTRRVERFSLFVALAVVALTLEMLLPETRGD